MIMLLQQGCKSCSRKPLCSLLRLIVFPKYDSFYDGLTHPDAFEDCLPLMSILNNGSIHCFTSNCDFTITSYDGYLSDYSFSFVLEQYTVCDVYGLRSPSFQSNSVLYITSIDDASLEELVMQELEGRLGKSCFKCKRNTRHLCSKQFLKPTKYLIINVIHYSYVDNQFIKTDL